ncbi:hypothetical protein AG1IA_08617 [Rhizoctonia solani AG-1 IA]|uniref:Uncharacterized protein n=1 Tax=Thanatephorus cucumeris (strain AG1-IA) TaxID=983506 RepID=L8WLZ0_THACA|nr:hypothetical protein AG1IA_08617 [Rhizoctonia solani AG-1 IA]
MLSSSLHYLFTLNICRPSTGTSTSSHKTKPRGSSIATNSIYRWLESTIIKIVNTVSNKITKTELWQGNSLFIDEW